MSWKELITEIQTQSGQIEQGGGPKAIGRQHDKGRMTARERIQALLDDGSFFLEVGRWAGWDMYTEWGGTVSGSVICGMGRVANRTVMIIANDATIKAGAFFPITCKKVLRFWLIFRLQTIDAKFVCAARFLMFIHIYRVRLSKKWEAPSTIPSSSKAWCSHKRPAERREDRQG